MAVDRSALMSMSKEDLADTTIRTVEKAKTIKEKAAAATAEILEFAFAAVGGGLAGYWIGSIQREINAGTEGYDEDSLKFFGVDKDLGAGLAAAVLSQMKQVKKFKSPLRAAGMGMLSFWTGRKAFNMALEAEVEEDE